jgi:hypothetical protein
MNRIEFDSAVDALLDRIDKIKFDDYFGAQSVLNGFKHFVRAHADQLSYGLDEGAGGISGAFSQMKSAKNPNVKMGHYSHGISNLRSDVESLKRNFRTAEVVE